MKTNMHMIKSEYVLNLKMIPYGHTISIIELLIQEGIKFTYESHKEDEDADDLFQELYITFYNDHNHKNDVINKIEEITEEH